MQFTLKANMVSSNPETRIAYCHQIGIRTVQDSLANIPGIREDGRFVSAAIRDHVQRYAAEGIGVAALAPPPVTAAMVLGGSGADDALSSFGQAIDAIGEAGVKVVTSGLPVPRPQSAAEDSEQFMKIVEFTQRLCERAGAAGVRLATHSPWPPNQLGWLWGTRLFSRLFDAVPHPSNGYLYDNAIHHMIGEDPVAAVVQLQSRIFFCHIRDVRKSQGDGAAGTGYDEVLPGDGELDFRSIFGALTQVGYRGGLCPEHLPAILGAGDNVASLAYAVGYLRGVLVSLS